MRLAHHLASCLTGIRRNYPIQIHKAQEVIKEHDMPIQYCWNAQNGVIQPQAISLNQINSYPTWDKGEWSVF
jgi:hypothetical protein